MTKFNLFTGISITIFFLLGCDGKTCEEEKSEEIFAEYSNYGLGVMEDIYHGYEHILVDIAFNMRFPSEFYQDDEERSRSAISLSSIDAMKTIWRAKNIVDRAHIHALRNLEDSGNKGLYGEYVYLYARTISTCPEQAIHWYTKAADTDKSNLIFRCRAKAKIAETLVRDGYTSESVLHLVEAYAIAEEFREIKGENSVYISLCEIIENATFSVLVSCGRASPRANHLISLLNIEQIYIIKNSKIYRDLSTNRYLSYNNNVDMKYIERFPSFIHPETMDSNVRRLLLRLIDEGWKERKETRNQP